MAILCCLAGSITKLPECGDLCGNMSEFGVVEGSPEPTGQENIKGYY